MSENMNSGKNPVSPANIPAPEDTRPIVIRTSDLAVGYNKKALISDISFEVKAGEILTLIGPNGAGKSTILKSIIRQLEKIGGTVYLSENPMDSMKDGDIARKMSILMTEHIRPELMTCRDIVNAGRYPYTGMLGILSPEDEARVAEAMELLHVTELADQGFDCISDGQRQRVMLARAICQEPEILIMDEPTSFLDIRHKLEMLAIIKQLVRTKKIAVILSLHELDLAQKCSDHILCVCRDHIDRYGTPDEIFSGDYVQKLYGVERGTYIEAYGCLELAKNEGAPEVFVIGGGGSGITTYRELQRRGIPFAAGILQQNDLDLPVAEALASKVVTCPAFSPIRDAEYAEALELVKSCREVISCIDVFGPMNEKNRELIRAAEALGKLRDLKN